MEPEIRKLVASDAEACAALRREMLADSPMAFMASPETDAIASEAERVRERLSDGSGNATFGAFAPELVGSVGTFREPHLKTMHKLHVWGMYVTGDARGKGIGRRLLEAAIAHARTLDGVMQVTLGASETSDAAQALYASLGFRAWGTEPRALRYDGREYDEIHMVLFLERGDSK